MTKLQETIHSMDSTQLLVIKQVIGAKVNPTVEELKVALLINEEFKNRASKDIIELTSILI